MFRKQLLRIFPKIVVGKIVFYTFLLTNCCFLISDVCTTHQAKNFAPEIREMIEPNLIYLDSPSRRNILLSKDWKNNNDIQTLFRASEGENLSTSFSLFLKYLNNIFFETNLIRICSLAVTGIASTGTQYACVLPI